MRLVLDTCVLIAAFRSRSGASRRLLNLLVQRRFQAVLTPALFFEYEAVLCRDEQIRMHGYTAAEIGAFLNSLATFALLVPRVHYQVKPQLRDAGDELVLEAALNGYAETIVTFNVADFLPAATSFGLRVISPGSILKERFRA